MRLRASTIYADVWAAWRLDWNVLTAVAGMFVFLPQLALLLLVPAWPDMSTVTSTDPNDPALRAAVDAVTTWIATYGGWYIVALAMLAYAQLSLVAAYLTSSQAPVGKAMVIAARVLPRMMLASVIGSLPLAVLSPILLRFPFLIMPVVALIAARMLLTGPAIIAARPIGAIAAIGRSVRATRGATFLLAGVLISILLAQFLIALPFLALDEWMTKYAPNPVARVMVDAVTAGASTLATIATALVQVTVWRRLSSS